jgi:Ricin-type beta-trefoil lectin domain-like/PQQ-like domain
MRRSLVCISCKKHGGVLTAIILLTLSAALSQAYAVDVLTQHNNQFRTGANTNETILTPANVNSTQFGKLFSYAVDGSVYAQPLYVSGLSISGGTHNVVYVVTMEDSVYAFDADVNTTYWHDNFTGGNITPVPITDITGNNNLNIHGDVGILSTPVIDLSSGTIYVLARTKNTSNNTHIQTLHALDITTGAEKFGGPVVIPQVNGFSSLMQNQRPGLAEANGNIYICWGSHEDITPYNGFIMAYNATTLAQTAFFNTTPGGSQGALWMAGQAPAIDNSGNLYVTTGNGDWNGTTKWGETCLKLSPTLSVLDWATPANYASLNSGDTDFGAGGCLLLPGSSGYPSSSYVVTGGKEGKIFVLDKNGGMGHEASGDTGIHQIWQAIQTAACSHHIHGTPVYWNSGSQGQTIYVWGENDVGKGFKFNGSTFTTTPWTTTSVKSPTTGCGMPGSILSLSANGNANGIVWANCVYTGDALHNTVPGILRAYDANNLGTELWDSYQNQARDDFGNLAKYCAPTIANGKVYMATFSGAVCVYGLLGSGPIADGTYKIINRNSGLAVDVVDSSTTNGTPVQQFTYNSGANQQWAVTGLGGGEYKIIGVQSGKTLDVVGGGTANGTLIDIWPYGGGANQQWSFTATSGGYYRLTPANATGSALDVQHSATTNGALLEIWGYSGGNSQQWILQAP